MKKTHRTWWREEGRSVGYYVGEEDIEVGGIKGDLYTKDNGIQDEWKNMADRQPPFGIRFDSIRLMSIYDHIKVHVTRVTVHRL